MPEPERREVLIGVPGEHPFRAARTFVEEDYFLETGQFVRGHRGVLRLGLEAGGTRKDPQEKKSHRERFHRHSQRKFFVKEKYFFNTRSILATESMKCNQRVGKRGHLCL